MAKILIVHSEPFFPISKGSDKVIYEYCDLLKEKGCELYYLYYGNNRISKEFEYYLEGRIYHYKGGVFRKFSIANIYRKLRLIFAKRQKVDDYYPIGIEHYIKKLNQDIHFDYCIVNYIILTRLFEKVDIPKKVLYSHDAFTNKTEWLGVDKFWLSLSPNEEAKGIRRCTDVISIQQNESTLFKYYSPHTNVYTVYSSFHLTRQQICNNKNILFIAGANQLNYSGIIKFMEEVFPIVQKGEPEARLIIGGSICRLIKRYASKNIELCGFVNILEDFYSKGDIVINPVYQGTGLKVKTFEALSFGKIVVAHRHSAEGIFDPMNIPVYFADTKEDMANQLLDVLRMKNRQIKSQESLQYIERLNEHVNSEYERLLSL